jgi:hypothetical protein
MSDKYFVLDLLFDDGVVHIEVEPPHEFSEPDFDKWSLGVTNGIAAYIRVTQEDHNFKKSPPKHKHRFKFIEPSDSNLILYFYCTRCQDQGQVTRAKLREELLGK